MAVITISRQYGSGGEDIAARVCALLGYRYFDKRLMAKIAAAAGVDTEELIDPADDRHQEPGMLERLFGQRVAEAWVVADETSGERSVEIGELDGRRYVTIICDLIQTAYRQGDVVIVGRGGQAVLRDQPGVLHVRVEAPLDDRVRRVVEEQRFTKEADAREFVMGSDRAAADYLHTYHNVDWADPTLYRLVINTSQWTIEAAAHLIIDALKYVPAAGQAAALAAA